MNDDDNDQPSRLLSGRGAYRHLLQEEINARPFARPPHTITWCPPHGAVVAHSSVTDAATMAQNFAGNHPGEIIAVYELVGFAHTPAKPAPFTLVKGDMIEAQAEETNGDQEVAALNPEHQVTESGADPAKVLS